jgi:hypothetical protein
MSNHFDLKVRPQRDTPEHLKLSAKNQRKEKSGRAVIKFKALFQMAGLRNVNLQRGLNYAASREISKSLSRPRNSKSGVEAAQEPGSSGSGEAKPMRL